MGRYIVIRLAQGLVTLVALSVVVFLLPRMAGDPVPLLLGMSAGPQEIAAFEEELGLDQPLPSQYFIYIKRVVRGDFGKSIVQHRPVSTLIRERFPASAKLAIASAVFAIPVGLLLGTLAAIKRNKSVDWLVRAVAVLGQSIPSFWLGIVLILFFSVMLGVLPTSGIGGPTHYILPVITLSWYLIAGVTRLTRSSMLEVLASDYVTFARAKGLPESAVILKHALRNALIPVVTFAVILFAFMLAGSIVTETVFAWPGLGRLAYQSIVTLDFPVIQGVVLLYGTIFVLAHVLADTLYPWLDPRIRYQPRMA